MPISLIHFAWSVKESIENKWKRDIVLKRASSNLLGSGCFFMSLNADHYIELQKESVGFLVWLYFMEFIYYSGAYTEIPKSYTYPHSNSREFGLLYWLADLLSKQNSVASVYLYFSYCVHMTSNYSFLYFYLFFYKERY